MNLYLYNNEGSRSVIDCAGLETVKDLKNKIIKSSNSLTDASFYLSNGFCVYRDDQYLIDTGLDECSTVYVNWDLLGGAKKRKKKKHTKPKKNKHKKKKVKAPVLKFYEVQGNTLVLLRRQCPNTTCGAGVFLARHFDRYYCGRCNMDYVDVNDNKDSMIE